MLGKLVASCAARKRSLCTSFLSQTEMTPIKGTASDFGLFGVRFNPRKLLAALKTQVIVLTSLVRQPNRLISTRLWIADPAGGLSCSTWTLSSFRPGFIAWALGRAATKAFFCSFLMLSLAAVAISFADLIGHSLTGRLRNSGPFCHPESSSRFLGLIQRGQFGFGLHQLDDGTLVRAPLQVHHQSIGMLAPI